jgi:hypothetical protein
MASNRHHTSKNNRQLIVQAIEPTRQIDNSNMFRARAKVEVRHRLICKMGAKL